MLGQRGRHLRPGLFIGAMLGGRWAPWRTSVPGLHGNAGAYALVGMGAAFAGVVRAPMTSVLMIFEMTQDYAVIVPLMIANLVSLYVPSGCSRSRSTKRWPQDGIHLPTAKARQRSDQRRIASIMRAASTSLRPQNGAQAWSRQVRVALAAGWS